jgi:hypothetical protein
MWSFCRFLHFIATKGRLNPASERSEAIVFFFNPAPNIMKNYSFIILAAIICLSALPSYAQVDPSSAEQTVTPPVESLEAKQSEPIIEKQQPAPEPDKCESVDR